MADRRPRPGALIVGTVFLLIGGLAVASDITTLDPSWILPIALMVAGVSGLVLITARIGAAADPTDPDLLDADSWDTDPQ
ncbi:MAG: hypothetical protein GY929_14535 [Actinomycetia bacterium]|nr:hypothetical protein [Actinomycetes bacterium]